MTITLQNWRMDSSQNAIIHNQTGEVRRLGEFHYQLLVTFIKHADKVLTRAELTAEVWKNRVVGTNSLPTAIHALRIALGDDGKCQKFIKTIPKKGYLFCGDCIDSHDEPPTVEQQQEQPPLANNAAPAPALSVTIVPPAKAKNRRWWLSFSGAAGLSALLVSFWCFHAPALATAAQPSFIKEPMSDLSQIAVYREAHLSEMNTLIAPNQFHDILRQANNSLVKYGAHLLVRYHASAQHYTIDLEVQNRCNMLWKTSLHLENWKQQDANVGELIASDIENTLHTMPGCPA